MKNQCKDVVLIIACIAIWFLVVSVSVSHAGGRYGALAISVQGEDVGDIVKAGAVAVIHASQDGLTSEGNQFWHQNSPGIEDDSEVDDRFGFAVASGDFNNDGHSDLAIAASVEDLGSVERAGVVHVLYGTRGGLVDQGSQIWHQDSEGIEDDIGENDRYGKSLAAADFNNDGFDDLAIGIQGETVDSVGQAGAVNILYGSREGLTTEGNQLLHQNITGIHGMAEEYDWFGFLVAADDFNNDGYADLAVSVELEDIGDLVNAGAVNIIYGSENGLTSENNMLFHQDIAGIDGASEAYDYFGSALATGDFDSDGYADLAIGVRGEAIGTIDSAGGVNILYGSENGLTSDRNKIWYQGLSGVEDEPEADDQFGRALAAGDFNNDGYDDLAIGATGETVGTANEAGAVTILFGSESGLKATGNAFLHQDTAGIRGLAEEGDNFGRSLVAADLNQDGYCDLAVGVIHEAIGTKASAGAVNVILGAESGLTDEGNQIWYQDSEGIADESETEDWMGYHMAFIPPSKPFPWKSFIPLKVENGE